MELQYRGGSIKELRINRGIVEKNKEYYPVYRPGAIFGWKYYVSKEPGTPKHIRFSDIEQAMDYIKNN